jgi:hypothetical protein
LEPEEFAPPQTSLTFWGFDKRPFSGPPASYWRPRHEDALSKLTRAIRGRKGLVVLRGEAGTDEAALLLDSRVSIAQF